MEIHDGINLVDLGIQIGSTLIICDTQIGQEEYLNRQGYLVPRQQISDMVDRIESLMESTEPKSVIINGDIKHEFGRISKSEWRQTDEFLRAIERRAKVTLIRGNHDIALEPLIKGRRLLDHVLMDNIYICHGHIIPDDADFAEADVVIIGHEHPALHLRDNGRVEKFKCFLKGHFGDKVLIVQPSFNSLAQGTDITAKNHLSPFINSTKEFEAFVVADEIMYFGRVGDL